ncbi:hypothetical protein DCS_07069 [Drechmeria coniospora]|uniref:Siderophore biosynthesis enzyme n=1 Tax=Drechmeria coniospora TaxID=98403 RepID=A0A151GDD1_DRECN|nr:hypothetical protein DCS_07069 [Drechmeria coniospora]KYK55107.1 hypothetical protein DCS_07069 [Drechmeria coniospora]
MSIRSLAFGGFLLLASPVLGRTDLTGCTHYETVVKPSGMAAYASRVWYVPDTYELCEVLDCGGGRAPPKTTVPGCPQYKGSESYQPKFIDPASIKPDTVQASVTSAAQAASSAAAASSASAAASPSSSSAQPSSTSSSSETTSASTTASITTSTTASASITASATTSGSASSSGSALPSGSGVRTNGTSSLTAAGVAVDGASAVMGSLFAAALAVGLGLL